MATTIRDQIIVALMDRLQPLINNPVVRMAPVLDDSHIPFISVWDLTETNEKTEYNEEAITVPVIVEYVERLQGREKPAEVLNYMLGKLKQTIFSQDATYGALAEGQTYESADFDVTEAGSSLVSVRLVLEIYYRTPIGDPYTAAT